MSPNVLVILGLVLSVVVLVLCTVKLKIHPFFALIATTVTFAVVSGMGMEEMLSAFTSGMGGTVADIGLVIALGTVTGALLEKSGAAETMAKTILKITGEKHAALGLAITGYFVSIPVFCDSAFVLLSPIAKRLSKDTRISMTTMAIAMCMGLHATHMFVPPTPGPLAVSGILSADLGQVILFGALVSIPVMLVGYFGAQLAGKKYYYLPKEVGETQEQQKLPSPVMAFLPILAPIALMLIKTIGDMCTWPEAVMGVMDILGTPAVALLVGLIIAAIGYHEIFPEDKTAWGFDGVFAEALRTAGQIVLIVGAGGAFSGVLKASPLQDILTETFSGLAIGILAPFLIGFLFRTCVGSATIAMVTAATMIVPLLDILGFASPMGRIIAMLACAAGGLMVFHGNDDFFWVTATTSEMDTSVAYKTIPLISVLQSLTALVCVFLLSLIFLH
ncbi:GntP family permease [Pseudoflavonifractor sp. DSM 107456]|uniref:GntP family permease n=1 Tax=Pseudoflavonifractor gallinarum TaxID=2779352 RepID=A0ABR9R935_9FIRM|nr:GntP family permease [Pseudoflavonifractor sp. MCC625]MBE5055151.1 GntP family permease [Pseudoflavonifractor gallinarum]MBS5136147.1 GntP family permease [Oscillospiraceae bacterium]MBT9685003.1 GntP family permease [Pseudoflavonifractor sp. MCC625]